MFNKHTFHQGLIWAQHSLCDQVEMVNKINVFPVADNDTGTNLYHSIEDIYSFISPSLLIEKQLSLYSERLFEQASGNSGFILSMLFHELATYWPKHSIITPCEIGQVFNIAAKQTKDKMVDYIEGGIVSYIEMLANFLISTSYTSWSLSLYQAIEANTSLFLADIAKLNPSLVKHQVVDAGALGVSYWLIGWFSALCQPSQSIKNNQHIKLKVNQNPSCSHVVSNEKPNFQYCVQATLRFASDKQAQVKKLLSTTGDCNLHLFQQNKMRFHVHTNTPQTLFTELMSISDIANAKVDDMLNQFKTLQLKQDIAIVTDSSADIPTSLIEAYHIHVIPMTITHSRQKMLDGLTITTEKLSILMQHSSEHPKTSTPPIGSVKKMFEFLSQNHQHVFAVSISSQMSTTFNVFTEVANTYNNISVVDSRRNSGAHGSIVTAIGKLAKAGCSYQAIQKQINKLIESTSIVVLVDNFKTMRKSGRVSKGRAYFADMINLKPLVGIDSQGRGEVLAKNFSRRGQQKKLMKILQQQHLEKPIKAFRVLHVDCLEGAQHIQSLLTNIYDNIPCEIMHASASVSLHAGKGTVAVSTE